MTPEILVEIEVDAIAGSASPVGSLRITTPERTMPCRSAVSADLGRR